MAWGTWGSTKRAAKGKVQEASQKESCARQPGRAVRSKGSHGTPNEPSPVQLPVATDVGGRDVPFGYLDSTMQELNAMIALRDAKALALSLGSPCCFGRPVLWSAERAICEPHPDARPLYVDASIMPRTVARWDKLDPYGAVLSQE